jgi:NAD(P)-dependent dehydrogenase (short-subunit alcohol dehydrogenase family)
LAVRVLRRAAFDHEDDAMTKTALVTGANRGLGYEIAHQLGQSGVRTLIAARDADKGEQAAAELAAEGLDVHTVVLDVDSAASVTTATEQVTKYHGRLDI